MRNFRNPIYLWIFLYTTVRLVLNGIIPFDHTGDGWGYACDLLKHDFKNGHHLLFQYFQVSHWQLFVALGGDKSHCIQWLTAINIVLGSLILLVSKWILDLILTEKEKQNTASWIVAFISVGMGFNRYSFENEAYTLPLLLELLAILFFQKLMLRATFKNAFILFATTFLAPLFHQTAIWGSLAVWLGLWIYRDSFPGEKTKQKILGGILFTGILWVLIYFLFARFLYQISLKELVFQDVINGSVETSWDVKTLGFTLVNLMRTFVEFKGSTILLLKSQPIAWIVLVLLLWAIVSSIYSIYQSKNFNKFQIRINALPLFQVILIATVLHLLFAIFSQGNHEFMMPLGVLVPFILAFKLNTSIVFKPRCITAIALWNAYFFYFSNFQNELLIQTSDKYQCLKDCYNGDKEKSNPIIFISNEASRIYNYADYLWLTNPELKSYANAVNCENNQFYRHIAIKFPNPNNPEIHADKEIEFWTDIDKEKIFQSRATLTYRPVKIGDESKSIIGKRSKQLEHYHISVID